MVRESEDGDGGVWRTHTRERGICANLVRATAPFRGLRAYHLFILTTDQRSTRYFYRAGPRNAWPSHGPVTVMDGHYIPMSPDWNGNGQPTWSETIPGWQAAQNLHSTLAAALARVGAARVSYDWFGPNSNSTVGEMLRAAAYGMLQPTDHAPGFRHVQPYSPHQPKSGMVATAGGTVTLTAGFGRDADLDSTQAAAVRRRLADGIRLGDSTVDEVRTIARHAGLEVSELMDGRMYASRPVSEAGEERLEHSVYVTFFFEENVLADYDITDAVTGP
jgi:hypothetical protein